MTGRLKLLGESETATNEGAVEAVEEREEKRATLDLLLLALKALSQRALVAATNSVTLLGLGSVFWLAGAVLEEPTILRLVCLGMYGAFVLALRAVWRR